MKHFLDKTKLADSAQKTSAAIVMLEVSKWLDLFTKNTALRYVQQLTYIITVVLGVIALISLKRLIPKTLRRAIFDKFLYALRKAASGLAKVSKKLFSIFGIKFDRYKKRKDERSFIFGEEESDVKRKRHSVKSSSKWRDMQENSERIRFLYIKYIVKLIKGGYKFDTALTPNEVRTDLDIDAENQDNEIFDLYNGARYSGGSVFISDAQVESVMALVNAKKK